MKEIEIEEIKNLITTGFQGITMHRITYRRKRGYMTEDPFAMYSGLTGALSAATFKGNQDNKRIEKWRDKMVGHLGGQEAQEAYLNSMADYGTLLHETLVDINNNRQIDWEAHRPHVADYFLASARKIGIDPNMDVIESQVFEHCKGAASMMQFFFDHVEEIHAIETMAKCDELGIATPTDIVCDIRDKKAGKLRIGINLKTSGQFGDHQREQVSVEKYLWNKTYPELQIDRAALLRPKDYKKDTPTYEFEVLDPAESDALAADAIQRLNLCRSNPDSTYINFPKSAQVFTGVMKLGGKPTIVTRPIQEILFGYLHQKRLAAV